MNWNTLWQHHELEYFLARIQHGSTQHNPVEGYDEKLAYLRDVLKDGPVTYMYMYVIEHLTQDAECYKKAVGCLQRHYDQPYLIHQALIHTIHDAPCLRDSNGKDLCRLHDVAASHLRPWTMSHLSHLSPPSWS